MAVSADIQKISSAEARSSGCGGYHFVWLMDGPVYLATVHFGSAEAAQAAADGINRAIEIDAAAKGLPDFLHGDAA